MRPLTLDDLLPLAEYADRRLEFFTAHRHYLDRYRRIRIGPKLTLVFENRQTLWFRVHEVLRIARLAEPGLIQQELDLSNRLLPAPNQLQAALLIEVPAGIALTQELAFWKELRGEHICLYLGDRKYPVELLTCRPEDRAIGAAHWVQIALDAEGRELLADSRAPTRIAVDYAGYQHDSGPLGADVRQSLIDDLQLSDRAD